MHRLACLLAVLLSPAALAQTNVGGSIAADSTWTLAGSPYTVTSTVTVQAGATLTIEPGVEVVFSAGRQLVVDGALVARGTEASPIRFSGQNATPGYWRGIRFSTTSMDAVYDGDGEYLSGSILEHFRLVHGGNWQAPTAAIELQNASPALRHLVVEKPRSTAILENRTEAAPPLRLRDVLLDRPLRYGIHLTGGSGHVFEDVRIWGPEEGNLGEDPTGILLENADSVLVDGCAIDDVTGATGHTAIDIQWSRGSIVRDSYTEDSEDGVLLEGIDNLVLRHTSVRDLGGIHLMSRNVNYINQFAGRIEDCDLIDGGGVFLSRSTGGEILNNRITGAVGRGITVSGVDSVLVRRNTAIDGSGGGAWVQSSTNVRFEENRITNNEGPTTGGVYVREADGLVFEGNDLSHNRGYDTGQGYGNLFYITALIGNPNQHYLVDLSGAPDGSHYNTLLDTTSTGYSIVVTDSIEVIADRVCWTPDNEPAILSRVDLQDVSFLTVSPFYTNCSSLLGTPGDDARPALPLAVRPNPMLARSVISFSLAEAAPVSLRVYDVRGREVARLAEGPLSAGLQEIAWDGRDAAGRSVAAGVYLIRLRTREGTAVQRIVRLTP